MSTTPRTGRAPPTSRCCAPRRRGISPPGPARGATGRTILIAAVAAVAAFGVAARVQAAPIGCSADSLTSLHIPDLTVTDAREIGSGWTAPAHCRVEGNVTTRGAGAPDGSAGFVLDLPAAWRNRFFFMGVGGNAGNFTPSVNPTDQAQTLARGYATIITDTGHRGDGIDASWVIGPDGHRDTAKIVDFFHRAAHAVTVAGKRLVEAYYGGKIGRAIFEGCSIGGRMAMMEAERYPTDFDGIIAGAPAMDYRTNLARVAQQLAQFSSREAYIPARLLPVIDDAVRASCDAADGVADGLIENPARCGFRPESLLCRSGAAGDCLSAAQVTTLRAWLAPLRDEAGAEIYPGLSPADLAGPHGALEWVTGATPPDLSAPLAPWGDRPGAAPLGWRFARQTLVYWLGLGADARLDALRVDPATGTVGADALRRIDETFAEAMTRDPTKLAAFVAQGRKLILYHGLSDPAITPFRTALFYEQFAALHGGYAQAQRGVRLFLVPGTQHCGGGPGPDQFDTLGALENWLDHDTAPDAILARATRWGFVQRTMPLCPFPARATYRGAGNVNDAANWSCAPNDVPTRTPR